MAKPKKLKVFCTPIGFHDAYVAAPSRKAALKAWGTTKDLFARGVAEEVTDPRLMKEPLATPGSVIRRSRGSAAAQIAALPKDAKARQRPTIKAPRKTKAVKPSRSKLDAAERALTERERNFDDRLAALKNQIADLEAQRRDLEKERAAGLNDLERARIRERDRYDDQLAKWRGD